MKLYIVSDLHVDHEPFMPPKKAIEEADVLIFAGDIANKNRGIDYLNNIFDYFEGKQIIYVLGNHEYYSENYPLKFKNVPDNIRILNNNYWEYGEMTFLGTTLWSDIKPYVDFSIAQYMGDFKHIRLSEYNYRKLTPNDVRALNRQALTFLERELSRCQKEKKRCVVVTHHAPSFQSVPEEFNDSIFNSGYATDLEYLIKAFQPELWIHGHVHTHCDYYIEHTRIVANPRGYPFEYKTSGFIENFMIEL